MSVKYPFPEDTFYLTMISIFVEHIISGLDKKESEMYKKLPEYLLIFAASKVELEYMRSFLLYRHNPSIEWLCRHHNILTNRLSLYINDHPNVSEFSDAIALIKDYINKSISTPSI